MWYRPNPAIYDHGLALLGLCLTVSGFGMLALDAAIGVLMIPMGVVLFIIGHWRRHDVHDHDHDGVGG